MIVRLYFLVGFLVNSLLVQAQLKHETDAYDVFGKKLEGFRYSLYEDLSKIDVKDDLLFAKAQDTTSAFYLKCKRFYSNHLKELIAYQQYILDKYLNAPIDTAGYTNDDSFDSVKEETLTMKEAFINTYLYRLLTADPISNASTIIQMAFVRAKDVSEMSRRILLQQIAQPRIRTEKINDDNWNIYWDEYNHIYVLSYQVSQQEMHLKNVYKRK